MSKRRVVITGLGTVNPLGNSVPAFWEGMLAGRSGVTRVTKLDASQYDSQIAGEVKDFPGIPEAYVSKREARRLDPFAEYAVAAAVEAVIDSGLDFQKEDRLKCGVVVGSGIGGLQELETQHERLMAKGPSKVSVFTIPKLMGNAASGNVSLLFGAKGINTSVATACASATNAMGDALRAIQRNDCDMMFTGGSEAALTHLGLSSFCAMKALSTRNDDPQRASRPFDKDRDGFIMAEGAGVLIFEELEHAKARGATIVAEVLGFGASADAYHLTAPEPDGLGAAMALRRALADAGVNPQDVEYINAHGTSTELGDIGETKAVKAVFGDHARKLAISSTKSQLGHLLGASGGAELITTILGMLKDTLPPTVNLENPDPQCDLDYVPNQPRPGTINVAVSNSFGFGGHNACIVVRRFAD